MPTVRVRSQISGLKPSSSTLKPYRSSNVFGLFTHPVSHFRKCTNSLGLYVLTMMNLKATMRNMFDQARHGDGLHHGHIPSGFLFEDSIPNSL